VTLYADDVVLFLRPTIVDIDLTLRILQLFGEASGLKTNILKSSVVPIQCAPSDLGILQERLSCHLENFPIKYHGLPLSIRKLMRPQVQPLIDKLLPTFQGRELTL
jgi:hypothetical protein